jgi:DNA-binding CsgD family transcriptional regulator
MANANGLSGAAAASAAALRPASLPFAAATPLQFGDSAELARLALAWLEHDDRPRVLVGEGATILWINESGQAELARKREVELRGGALAMTDHSLQPKLEAFLESCGGDIGTWNVPRADADGQLLFRARRLSRSPSRCGVTFYGSGSEFTARYADLDSVFGLTKAELHVLLRLLDGHDALTIAASEGVSIETTRSHIRSIYLKLEVNSREGLFHLLRPYRL